MNGEFEKSTANNEKSLGGRTAQLAEEDEETSFDVNMDKIMQRFKCFNQVQVSNNSEDDDSSKDDTDSGKETDDTEQTKVEVKLPQIERLEASFSDAGFWKVDGMVDDVDALLEDYE